MNDSYVVTLSMKEADYLRNLTEQDSIVAGIPVVLNDNSVTTNSTISERLGNRLTELQAEIGFDSDYELTAEGTLLGNLIYAFITPSGC